MSTPTRRRSAYIALCTKQLNAASEARHRLDDGNAAPDLDDLVAPLSTLLAALSESVMAVNSG